MTEANELWKLRQDVMGYEDEQTYTKSQIDSLKNYNLGNDGLIKEMVGEHNELVAIFDKEVEEATKHLNNKLLEIQKIKHQIHTYSTYILLNDKLLAETTKDYNEIKSKWESAITKYTIGLDKFVESGEVKDV